jgi:hypothetical protein
MFNKELRPGITQNLLAPTLISALTWTYTQEHDYIQYLCSTRAVNCHEYVLFPSRKTKIGHLKSFQGILLLNTLLPFEKGVLAFSVQGVLALSVKGVLVFEKTVLVFEKIVLVFEKIVLAFEKVSSGI